MTIVCDTSPLNYLVLVHSIEVLPTLFSELYTTSEVIGELRHARAPELVRRWAQRLPAWLHVAPADGTATAPARLGAGETSAVFLAKALRARWVLMDDRDGARFAVEQGLRVIGTLAVLEQAACQDLLDLPSVLHRLQATTFRISLPLIRAALERGAARKAGRSSFPGDT